MNPNRVIHLVPGTFARDARWCRPDSQLSAAIRDRFGSHTLIEVHQWSTANSHAARSDAGLEMRDKLRASLSSHPLAEHFIIAHSHGGNVVSYALEAEDVQCRVRGVVYLATPHVRTRARDLDASMSLWLAASLPMSAQAASIPMMLAIAGLLYVIGDVWESPGTLWAGTVLLTYLAGCALLTGVVHRHVAEWLFDRLGPLVSLQTRIVARIEPPLITHVPVLNVGTPIDEAAVYLRILRHFAAVPFVIWRPRLVLVLLFLMYGALGIVYLLFFGQAIQQIAAANLTEARIPRVVGFLFALTFMLTFPMLIAAATACALHVTMLVAPRIIRSPFYGFGGESFLDNLLVDIFVSDRPNAAQVETVSRWIPRVRWLRVGSHRLAVPRLAHCGLYDDPHVVQRVMDWIAAPTPPLADIPMGNYRRRSRDFPLGL
jgi:hypothetical protein